jgi:membrane-associated phospholipid phosphatase
MSPDADAMPTMPLRLRDLSLFEQLVLAVSFILFSIYVLDPFFLERSKALAPEARSFLQTITNVGQSNWMLIPAGSAVALALVLRRTHSGFRNAAGYGLIASTIGFVFVSVGGAGLIANLGKYIFGRARPKLFDTLGPFDFQLFSFTPDHASFPSGHATNIFALATVLGMLWPRGRVLLYTMAAWVAASRVLIGQHYFTDAVGGAILGTVFPYFVRERFAARRWLFEPLPGGGGYRLRGERTRNWLGWPGTSAASTEK